MTRVNPVDMARLEKSIQEALYFADYVIISMHSHQIKGTDKTEPDYFYEEFAHKCIDAGAQCLYCFAPFG